MSTPDNARACCTITRCPPAQASCHMWSCPMRSEAGTGNLEQTMVCNVPTILGD
jgi:hypothetical protein